MSEKLAGKCVVVIEDNDVIRDLFVLLLKRHEARIHPCRSGKEALDILRNTTADIVLCDIILPDLEGVEILQTLRSWPNNANAKVIALTAVANTGDRDRFLKQGFDGYMPKPINPATFVDDILAIVNQS